MWYREDNKQFDFNSSIINFKIENCISQEKISYKLANKCESINYL